MQILVDSGTRKGIGRFYKYIPLCKILLNIFCYKAMRPLAQCLVLRTSVLVGPGSNPRRVKECFFDLRGELSCIAHLMGRKVNGKRF